MKKCPFCKADIEDNARFCLYCMKPLNEKEIIPPPQGKKPWWHWAVVAVVMIIALWSLRGLIAPSTSDVSDGIGMTQPTENINTVPTILQTKPTTDMPDQIPSTLKPTNPIPNPTKKSEPAMKPTKPSTPATEKPTAAPTEIPTTPATEAPTQAPTASVTQSTTIMPTPMPTQPTTPTQTKEPTVPVPAPTTAQTAAPTEPTARPTYPTTLVQTVPPTEPTAPVQTAPATTQPTQTITVPATTGYEIKYSYRSARAGDDFNAMYENTGSDIVITGVVQPSNNGVYDIPSYIDGKKVIAIAANAFSGANAEVVYVPETVKNIWNGAFTGCNLTDIYFRGNAVYTEKNALISGVTIHCSASCSDRNFRYYKNSAASYGATWEEWNG